MPVISVLASSSLSGIQVCPCGPHANLFDRCLAGRRTSENFSDTDRHWRNYDGYWSEASGHISV